MSPAPRRCSPPPTRRVPPLRPRLLARRARAGAVALRRVEGAGRGAGRTLAASTCAIVRPPAVYGPGDRETLELFKMAKRGLIAAAARGPAVADPCRRPRAAAARARRRRMTPAACWSSPTTAGAAAGATASSGTRSAARSGAGRSPLSAPAAILRLAARARPACPPRQRQADRRPRRLFLPSRLGRRSRERGAARAVAARKSTPTRASRRPPLVSRAKAGFRRHQLDRHRRRGHQHADQEQR